MWLCPSVMYEPGRPSTAEAEEKRRDMILSLSRSRDFEWVHPNFYHSHIYPIGITWSHAFTVAYSKEERNYHLYALKLDSIDSPHKAMREKRQFSSSWKRWPGQLKAIRAACCYLGRVCVVTKTQLLVLDAANDWQVVVKLTSKDFCELDGCTINHKYLAFFYNSQSSHSARVCVYSLESKKVAQTNINNVRATTIHIPEELSNSNGNSIYVGFDKRDASGNTIDTPTCVFEMQEQEEPTLKLINRFVAWPINNQNKQMVEKAPDLIQQRMGAMLQCASNQLICYFPSKQNMFLATSSKIIHAQPVSSTSMVIFQGNNTLLLTDSAAGVNFSFEAPEICGPCGIASAARLQGIPDYIRCYNAFRVTTTHIVILLPNGSICFIRPCKSLLSTFNNNSSPSASSSSSSSQYTVVSDDDE